MSEFHEVTRPVARKDHRCWQCQGTIAKGRLYYRSTGMTDGEFFSHAQHFECHRAWVRFNWGRDSIRDLSAWEEAYDLREEVEVEEREWIVERFPVAADNLGWLTLNAPVVWC